MSIQVQSILRAALPLVAFAMIPGSTARADGVQVVLAGSHVQRIISGGVPFRAEDLVTGHGSGQVSVNAWESTASR